MLNKYFFIIAALLIFLFQGSAIAQDLEDSVKVSLQLNNSSVKTFAEAIEAQTDYHVFFDSIKVDSIRISINVNAVSIKSALAIAFDSTSVQYSIDHRKNIFLHKNKITTTLDQNFYENTQVEIPVEKDIKTTEPIAVKLQSALENKLFTIGDKTNDLSGTANLAGHVKDYETGEAIIGAVVFEEVSKIHAVTDQYGYYSMTMPKGKHVLRIQSTGMKNTRRSILLYNNGTLNVEMGIEVQGLKEVVIESEKINHVSGMQMGHERLTMKSIKQIPMVFGEADILRAILLLPGVKTVGEASTGFNVRGGATDQNLILFNDGVIFNPSHLFGFFSAFNPDVVKTVELYKSNIPAKFGGRLSSVLEINGREGNRKKYIATGGIGILTGRLAIEGPIVKDKISFLVAGRSSYSNWLLAQLKNSSYSGSRASFYDVNLGISYEVNKNNQVYLTGYKSADEFRLKTEATFHYTNNNIILKWKHTYSNKFYSVFTGGYTKYLYQIKSEAKPVDAYQLSFEIKQLQFKADQTYFLSNKHTLEFGFQTNKYNLAPGRYLPFGSMSKVKPDVLSNEQALESAFYLSDNYEINARLSIQVGLRYSIFNYLGPRKVYRYLKNEPRTEYTITDSTNYGSGDFINTYHGPEIRASGRYLITENFAVKASYNTLRQHIHLLTNTTAISPTDIWKLSDPNIKPTLGSQVSLGLYKNFSNNSFELSLEGYYKNMRNYIDYKGGAVLLQNHTIEREIVNTIGKSYGIEAYVKKTNGKVNGWVSYTYSRTFLKMKDAMLAPPINNGNWYPSNFDKPHDFTFVGNYKFSHRFNLSFNMTYSTGRPITLPIAMYEYGGSERVLYGDRNQYRIPDYFRMDISVNIEGSHVVKKLAHGSWTFAVYNLSGRRNPYSVYFKSENGKVNGYKLSIFGQPIPTITYNFRF